MLLTPKKINIFTFLKLPSAYFCGVRVKSITFDSCTTAVKHRWINQNPFNSMFWAVQGMAAELSTGALVMAAIKESNKPISMLVLNNRATFTKKATGRIFFTCNDGEAINQTIKKAISLGQGQTCWMKAVGTNSDGVEVSVFEFEWTVRLKK